MASFAAYTCYLRIGITIVAYDWLPSGQSSAGHFTHNYGIHLDAGEIKIAGIKKSPVDYNYKKGSNTEIWLLIERKNTRMIPLRMECPGELVEQVRLGGYRPSFHSEVQGNPELSPKNRYSERSGSVVAGRQSMYELLEHDL